MFDCTLTEVEVWADDASNFRTRWRFYNRMKERKVDAAARQPLVLSKKYFLPNVMQLKENGSFGECLGDSYQRTHLTEGGHNGRKSLILAPQEIPDISGYQWGFGCQFVKAYITENPVTNQKIL